MRARLAQCLCGPARHAILAVVINDDALPDADVIAGLRLVVDAMLAGRGAELNMGMPSHMDGWCALCGAVFTTWHYEIGWTIEYPSWEAAQAAIAACGRRQQATQELLTLLDATYNTQLHREIQ